jgi:hypothetical protein
VSERGIVGERGGGRERGEWEERRVEAYLKGFSLSLRMLGVLAIRLFFLPRERV